MKAGTMIKFGLALAFAGLAGVTSANAAMVYTDEASFLGAINPGYYLNEFNDLASYGSGPLAGPLSYTSGGFSYDVSSGGSPSLFASKPWGGDNWAIAAYTADDLTVTFTSGNVTAVGGIVFSTAGDGSFLGGNVIVNLSDATSVTVASDLFRGFVTSTTGPLITSLTITSLEPLGFASLDHLYVGTTSVEPPPPPVIVPEPTTVMTGALLLLPFGVSALRLLRKNRTA